MTEQENFVPDSTTTSAAAMPADNVPESTTISRIWVVLGVVFILVVLAFVVFTVTVMINNPARTETIRDIMIIFVALESVIIGLALVILLIQLARLSNLLRYEIKPILETTNETLNSLRGTTRFLGDNLVTPVVKANSSFAAIRRAIELIGFRRPQ